MIVVLWLFSQDVQQVKEWFTHNSVSRILVLVSFLLLFALIGAGGYVLSWAFFTNLASYSAFGFLSATYLLQAAILVLGFLFSVTALATTLTMLLHPPRAIRYLITLPIHTVDITVWLFVRTFLLNAFFLLVILLPIGVAFGQQFFAATLGQFLVRYTAAVLLLVFVTNAIGGIGGYLLALPLRKYASFAGVLGLIVGVIITLLVLRLIFPKQIVTLYHSSPDKFLSVYHSLPLNNTLFPTYWLTDAITNNRSMFLLPLLIFLIGIVALAFLIEIKRFLPVMQTAAGEGNKGGEHVSFANVLANSRFPITQKDILSILRTPSEISYGLFLLLMGGFFFLLLGIVQSIRPEGTQFAGVFVLFVFLWLLFFAISYLLRLVFPLFAREGTGTWYLFSLPINRKRILGEKIFLGVVLSFPYVLIGGLLWMFFPLAGSAVWGMTGLSLVAIVTIAGVQSSLGGIFPNFSEAESPERVSTSIMGIVTLLVSLGLAGLFGLLAYFLIVHVMTLGFVLLLSIETGLFFFLLVWVLAKSHLERLMF